LRLSSSIEDYTPISYLEKLEILKLNIEFDIFKGNIKKNISFLEKIKKL